MPARRRLRRDSLRYWCSDCRAVRLDALRQPDRRLVIFGGHTAFDFNRLLRATVEDAVPFAASIFLDILNVLLFMLERFRGESE